MESIARSSRWLMLLYVACVCATARGQSNSVSLGLTSFIIQGELNQVTTSLPFQVVAAPAYVYTITGNVHGVGPVFSMLVPTSEPVTAAFEAISKGLSSALGGSVSNPGAQLPATLLDEQVTSGTNGVFNATFSLSLDPSGVATFSITNVALVINGQPDTTDRLVFDSGDVTVTALFADVNVTTDPATNTTAQGATLHSSIICPNKFEAYFVYGTTGTSASGTSGMLSLAASGTAQAVSIAVTGLLPHTTYYFRGVGQDVTGPSYGQQQKFNTLDIPPVAGNVTAFAGLTPLAIPVLASATDPNHDKLKVTSVTQPIAGIATVAKDGAAAAFQFTSSDEPEDHFTYTIADEFGGSSTGRVTVVNYATMAGTYSAVLLNPGLQNAGSGFLRLTLAATGRFTGALTVAGVTYPFADALDSSGQFSTTLKLSKPDAATITLDMVQAGSGYVLNAGVASNGMSLVATLPPAAAAAGGIYTLLLPPPQGASYVGSGYARLQIAPSGLATITGALPDGAPFSCPSAIDTAGKIAVFSLLYAPSNRGSLAGTLGLSGSGAAVISGTLVWTKPASASAAIDQGPFSMALTGSGAPYIPPVHAAALQFGTPDNIGQATISGGNLGSPIQCLVEITPANAVLSGGANDSLALTITPATGLLSGHFIDPLSGATRTIHGILLQGAHMGGGYFLGDSEGGTIGIGP